MVPDLDKNLMSPALGPTWPSCSPSMALMLTLNDPHAHHPWATCDHCLAGGSASHANSRRSARSHRPPESATNEHELPGPAEAQAPAGVDARQDSGKEGGKDGGRDGGRAGDSIAAGVAAAAAGGTAAPSPAMGGAVGAATAAKPPGTGGRRSAVPSASASSSSPSGSRSGPQPVGPAATGRAATGDRASGVGGRLSPEPARGSTVREGGARRGGIRSDVMHEAALGLTRLAKPKSSRRPKRRKKRPPARISASADPGRDLAQYGYETVGPIGCGCFSMVGAAPWPVYACMHAYLHARLYAHIHTSMQVLRARVVASGEFVAVKSFDVARCIKHPEQVSAEWGVRSAAHESKLLPPP